MDHFLVEIAAPIPLWPNWKTRSLQLSDASTYTVKKQKKKTIEHA